MNRRAFIRNAAVTAAVAPVVPAAIARVTAPLPARQLLFVEPSDLRWMTFTNPGGEYDWVYRAWMEAQNDLP